MAVITIEKQMKQCRRMSRHGYAPYKVKQVWPGFSIEFMSYPFPGKDGNIYIMARLVPGDPTTLGEIIVLKNGGDK